MTTQIAPAPQPWAPSNTPQEPHEVEFLEWLESQGVAFEKETHLFSLLTIAEVEGVSHVRQEGFAPDVRVLARPGEWGEQYLEFTAATCKRLLKKKVHRCKAATEQYEVPVALVVANLGHRRKGGELIVPTLDWNQIQSDPGLLLDYLRTASPVPKLEAEPQAA